MNRSRSTEAQIAYALKQVELGRAVGEIDAAGGKVYSALAERLPIVAHDQ
ncbi:hypothetical protein [Stenotrophomonas rhizophila]|nr:hypothetical protein [Stenotrophomonas rhizophila]MCC7633266.1 hypothetical protein [Stenotrophomonas rhizophila]